MPVIDDEKLPIAGQMAANADPDKKKKFLEGFLGKKEEPEKKGDGMISAMKRKMYGG